jgi:hypothetical protein
MKRKLLLLFFVIVLLLQFSLAFEEVVDDGVSDVSGELGDNFDTCSGCFIGGECFEVGSVVENDYCLVEDKWVTLKKKGEACESDFDCTTSYCRDGTCATKWPIFNEFFHWICSWFQ